MTKRLLFSILITLAFSIPLKAQIAKQMTLIEGGTYNMGEGYQYEIDGWRMRLIGRDSLFDSWNSKGTAIGELPDYNNVERRVTVSSFYLSNQEVTNAEYLAFLKDSLLSPTEKAELEKKLKAAEKAKESIRPILDPLVQKALAANLLPDTACWSKDFPHHMDPIVTYYLWHPAFTNYPVVGVSWNQANAYCNWLSHDENAKRIARGLPLQPNYRLPTEAEWEYAARNPPNSPYPWDGRFPWDNKGQIRANIKVAPGEYANGDNYAYTAPVKTFAPNAYGLYNMAGNVSEWTQDVFRFNTRDIVESNPHRVRYRPETLEPASEETGSNTEQRVIKGGSWADYHYAAHCGSRAGLPEDQGFSRVGFRVAMTKVGSTK